MKDEQREDLMNSLENLSMSGSVIMTFTVLLIALKLSGFNLIQSIVIASVVSIAVLILRLKK